MKDSVGIKAQSKIEFHEKKLGSVSLQTKILQRMRESLKESKALEFCSRVVVGCSGGIDSSVMLHHMIPIAEESNLDVIAVHIHHGIRGEEAERDAHEAEKTARSLSLEFHVIRLPVSNSPQSEGFLRQMRRDAFMKILPKVDAQRILLAHHEDDLLETFFMRLFAGTDLRGLMAIRPFTPPYWVRPMLKVSRKMIEEAAEMGRIPYVHDTSNDQTHYRRNFLRRNLIPQILTTFNPNLSKHIRLLSESISGAYDFLSSSADQALSSALDGETPFRYRIRILSSLDSALRRFCIQRIFERLVGEGAALQRNHIEAVEKLIMTQGGDRTLPLPNGVTVVRWGELIEFVKYV